MMLELASKISKLILVRHICNELITNLYKTYSINLNGWEVHLYQAKKFSRFEIIWGIFYVGL